MPKVSVIITCYNKAKYIAESINSVFNQTYADIELVIFNDGSTDNSANLINEIIKDKHNIKFINNIENKGVIYARNTAIEASSGEYILPLDADDTIEPTYIEKAVKILDEDKTIGIVYCKAKFIGRKNKEWHLPEYSKSSFLYRNCIFCTALFRKSDFIKAGKYKESVKNTWEDWDLWLSIIEMGLIPYRINEYLFNYRQCEESTRSNDTDKNYDEGRRIIIKNHIDLYLNDSNFIKTCFKNNYYLTKKRKYKILLNILLLIITIETFVIGTLIYFVR